jgi:hypothetical protein
LRLEVLGQALAGRTEAIGAPSPGIDDHSLQRMLGLEPLPDEIPEGEEGRPKAFVKARGSLEAS